MAISKRIPQEIKQSYDFYGQKITISSGILAPQADAAVSIQLGDNLLLFTVVMDKNPRPGTDFLPLTIDYRESYSAAGKIGGAAYRRREAKPSDNLILYARLTDRALRPLFPQGMINGVVISITPLSIDHEQDLGMMSLLGSSLVCMMAGLPLDGPVGAIRIGYHDENFVINPSLQEIVDGQMNLMAAGQRGSINMIELDGKEANAKIVTQGLDDAQVKINEMIDIQEDYLSKLTITAQEITLNTPSDTLKQAIQELFAQEDIVQWFGNNATVFSQAMDVFTSKAKEHFSSELEDKDNQDYTDSTLNMAVFEVVQDAVRTRTLQEKKRLDDRDLRTIRPLYTAIDVAPRVHGSALFWRGGTQVLSSVTLGSIRDSLLLDTMEHTDVDQRYFHHYNFPPFSVADARPIRFVSRREIGHGKLAEKALEPVLPNKEEFPYSIRVVSDCLASSGSTSMGATCGSTLSLMAAGVPLTRPVSGIAMGLMAKQDNKGIITDYEILTDLMGLEDFMGDMDFKLAGTTQGITAIQLDTKVKGLNLAIIKETIELANTGRNEILELMLETINAPRKELSVYAPKLVVIKIDPDKVKLVIGKGGEMIDKIIEESGGVKIDFEDDGSCYIAHQDQEKIDTAIRLIKDITEDLPFNTPLEGKIGKVENYGFFIDLPKKEGGLVHISKLGDRAKPSVEANFKEGDIVKVIATGKDDKGRLKLILA